MSKTQIFLLGATGFIGGTILNRLLEHPNRDSFKITVLVRSAEKAKKLENLELNVVELNVVVGSTEDSALFEKLAFEADVVIAAVCRPCAAYECPASLSSVVSLYRSEGGKHYSSSSEEALRRNSSSSQILNNCEPLLQSYLLLLSDMLCREAPVRLDYCQRITPHSPQAFSVTGQAECTRPTGFILTWIQLRCLIPRVLR